MLSLIVAASENHVIGCEGRLPWRLSSDLKRFKNLTMGHALIMGRKTFESIGRALPGRRNIVVTRSRDWTHPDVVVAHGLEQAIEQADADQEVFVIGGAEIYRLAMPLVDRVYLTQVHATVQGDTFFETLSPDGWKLISQEFIEAGSKDDYDYTLTVWEPIDRPDRSPAIKA